jgi:transposase
MLSQEELKRVHVIKKLLEKRIKQREAAEILGLSTRQVRRLLKRIKREGEAGAVHKSRGKPSGRKLPMNIRDKVIKLYRGRYKGFGPTLAAEKLHEIEDISISDETLRLWLIESGDWKKARKRRKHRQWRERKHYNGEMIQIDGSHHEWFEGRGEECVLMGYIDDATGRVYARFYEYEGTIPAMDSSKRYIRKYGIPMSIYLDKHTTYKSPAKPSIEDEINNRELLSQFERAMKELGVEVIHAHSPQAKGRIERLFRTFQDRVVKEMRLREIRSIEEGNRFLKYYLPIYNRRFAVKAKDKENLHRKVPKGLKLDSILCRKTERTLRNDFTVSYKGKLYQIKDSTKAGKVIVEERISGALYITYKGERLRFREITERPLKEIQKKQKVWVKKKYKPSGNHPWRQYQFKSKNLKTGS